MTMVHEYQARSSSLLPAPLGLEDKFEVLREIGDGSFGSVVLARTRTAGSYIARRGSLIAIKTMKKTFDSFAPCLELREVIFLRTLPTHPHLVPALDIFLDPLSSKLHICMEYMDGNLYQLMKARDHKCMDGSSVKSILFQILGGLEHIHAHNFFHRDIKPENILVSTTAPIETTFRRYSSLMTPPSTPPLYTIKIADFGLARETHSQHPYTTYVSTRWYRAPEVLLRAGEYSAPVDMWALGAMAVEIANLKPLFPGGNEVDQVWRVCEIMGSPGNWYDRDGKIIGGGEWKEGVRLASKLGFSFPKMAPHSLETILRTPQWPLGLSNFVTWCLMWDPQRRPTSTQALQHEYFADAADPLLRPKSSRLLSKKLSNVDSKSRKESVESPPLSSKPSWFRKSFVGKENGSAISGQSVKTQVASPRPSPVHATTGPAQLTLAPNPKATIKARPFANKRATWAHGANPANAAPMPILPSIRPISPFSATVTAQAHTLNNDTTVPAPPSNQIAEGKASKKIGRQLSVASNGNHYADYHRQEAERALNGNRDISSPSGTQKESFFSHLRKRARRLSGRPQAPMSPTADDVEANAGCGPWQSNRSSMAVDQNVIMDTVMKKNVAEVDRALQSVKHSAEASSPAPNAQMQQIYPSNGAPLERHSSVSSQYARQAENGVNGGLISNRTRRALQLSTHPSHKYETPDEEDEILHEALSGAAKAVKGLQTSKATKSYQNLTPPLASSERESAYQHSEPPPTNSVTPNPYPTPSSSAKRNSIKFDQYQPIEPTSPLNIQKTRPKDVSSPRWPTPPYEENEWAKSAAASIFAAGSFHH